MNSEQFIEASNEKLDEKKADRPTDEQLLKIYRYANYDTTITADDIGAILRASCLLIWGHEWPYFQTHETPAFELMFAAAICRYRLATNRTVTARELSAYASRSYDGVIKKLAALSLIGCSDEINASSARQWLDALNLP